MEGEERGRLKLYNDLGGSMEVRLGRVGGGRGGVSRVETESPIWKLYKTLSNLGKRLWKQKEH